MTQSNSDFLAEITRFLQADELGTGFPTEIARTALPLVVGNTPVDLGCTAADDVWFSNSSNEKEAATSSRVEGTKRTMFDEYTTVAKRPKCYWARVKQERTALQYEARQLSKRLSVLMQKIKKKNDRGTSATSCIATWKTIALCLQAERQQAEDVRYQLQVAVESQNFFIQQFYTLLVKQLGGDSLVHDQIAQQCVIEQQKDSLIFTAHIAELDVNYACTDDIFSTTEVVFMGERISVNPDGTVKCLQNRVKHKYPFDFYRSCDSMWELFYLHNQQTDRATYTDVTNPNNTYAFKFRVSSQPTKETRNSLLVRVAMRRYVADNQMVMVWRIFTEGEGTFRGIHCSESGWARARPCETGTAIEMYIKMVPGGFHSTAARFYEAVSLFREVAQDHEARMLNGLASFDHDRS